MGKKKIHIVQVGWDDTVFNPERAGSDSLKRQLEYASELNRQVPKSFMTIIVLTPLYGLREKLKQNLRIIPVHFKRKKDFIRLFLMLVKIHKKFPINVLASQDVAEIGWCTLLFGLIKKIPVVGQIHYDIFSLYAKKDCYGKGWKGELRYLITLKLLRLYSALRVVGSRTQREIMKNFTKPVALIPVPVTMMQNAVTDNIGERKPIVLFVGRLVWQKNPFLWLEIAALVAQSLPSAKFRIIGDGPLKVELQRKSRILGIEEKVQFLGEVPYKQLHSHYREASVFLLTSWYEGFGRVLVESYIHELPVVAARIAGVEDIVDDGITGFLHNLGENDEMVKSILKLLQNKDLQVKMGTIGKRKVLKKFNPQVLTKRWVSFLIENSEIINHWNISY
jgi:glycosyltransferase involved in cell wall biosynthesis